MKNRTYRYAHDNILFPFGYGLTYSRVICEAVEYKDGKASVKVFNDGAYDVEDVIQLYIKDSSPYAAPNPVLCGFERIKLRAGESRSVTVSIPERAFTSVDESGTRKRFSDSFTLYAGTHQPDKLSAVLSSTECAVTEIKF